MTRVYITFLTVCMALSLTQVASCEDADLSKLFADRNVDGTIVISSLDGSKTYVHNERRASTPFLPASTFKILNTLIALDELALAEKETMKWDGKDRGIEAWNCDQTLKTAFKSSCVWFYQELARRIGTAKYEAHLAKAGYGNAKPGPELTTFWLDGDLKISPMEQIEFLKKVYSEGLPFQQSSYEILKRIMIVDQTPTCTIRAKTGWAQRVSPEIGWFVGCVEAKDKVWLFATNIEIKKPEDARYRQEITLEALKLKGIR
jgi:beta-lactamase class D